MNIFKAFWLVIKVYLINPILRWWNFHIRHTYIPDNGRNNELMEFFLKVAADADYEPSTPTEIFFENTIRNDFNENWFCEEDRTLDEEWKEYRPMLYTDLAGQMLEFRWIDDRDW